MAGPELQIGRSSVIAEIETQIAYAAASSAGVLITGEAGCGKELIARLIHQRNGRAAPFHAIDCRRMSETQLESALIERGSKGTLGGTVLLTGVVDVSRRIQDFLFDLLGTPSLRGVRLIVATSRDLYASVVAGEFREDLYYRLNVIHLCVPPLRDRKADVALLVDHFLDSYALQTGGHRRHMPADVVEALAAYEWPGNVGELKDVIEQLARSANGRPMRIGDLPAEMLRSGTTAAVAPGGLTCD